MAVIYAKDALAAQRAMSLVDSPHSFWECFDILLKAHFIWVAWLSLRREGREIAQDLRGDMPILDDGKRPTNTILARAILSGQYLASCTPPFDGVHSTR
ncbi:MAG: hypothetical protein Q7T78_24325 [Rhodoferax sp.]|nr:hypothetical protein [Rhodoferax sp.]